MKETRKKNPGLTAIVIKVSVYQSWLVSQPQLNRKEESLAVGKQSGDSDQAKNWTSSGASVIISLAAMCLCFDKQYMYM